jgi:hypothetical protein
MVSQSGRRGHSRGGAARRKPRSILLRLALGLAGSLALLLVVVLWLLPELGRRGNLNQLVEETIRSALSVPVRIGRVETDALSEFSITRVSSLTAEAESRFLFQCRRLTAFYRPLELIFEHRVRELTAQSPSLFLDLDRDLSGIVRLPPRKPGEPGYTVDRFRISDGRLVVQVGGRELALTGLELDSEGIGGSGDLRVQVAASLMGSRLTIQADLRRSAGPTGEPQRFQIQAARLEIEGLDVSPLLQALAPSLRGGGGLLSLSGSARGVWPEEVEVDLSSRLMEGSAAPPDAPSFLAGEGDLRVQATVLGELDRVDFSINLGARSQVRDGSPQDGASASDPVREEGALEARGRFEKKGPSGGGLVRIDEARMTVEGLGRLEVEGEVSLAGEEPTLDLGLRLPPLPLERLERHPLGAPLRGFSRFLEGNLELEAHAGGPLSAPELAVGFRLKGGGFVLGRGRKVAAELTGEAPRISILEGGAKVRLEGVQASVQGLDLEGLAQAAGPRPSLDLHGKVDLRARAAELLLPLEKVDAELDLSIPRGSLSLKAGSIEAPSFEARVTAAITGDARSGLQVRLEAALGAKELGIGQAVETLAERPLTITGQAGVSRAAGGLEARLDLKIDSPSTGPVAIQGSVAALEGGSGALDLAIQATSIPNARFLSVYLRDPFRVKLPFLDGAQFSGSSSLEARLQRGREGLALGGTLRVAELGAVLGTTRLEGLSLSVPFRLGKGADQAGELPGFLAIRSLRSPAMALNGARVEFTLAGSTYRVPAGLTVPLFGGTLKLGEMRLRPLAEAGRRLEMSLQAREVRLEELTPFLGFPVIPGRLLLDVRDLTFAGEKLLIDGVLGLDVFRGHVELEGLSIDHFFSPYRVYSLTLATAREIDLARVGKTFRFGLASGVLQGWVRDLVTTGSEVVSFEADFQTVPRKGVSQFLDQRAIQSIRRTLTGPFGEIRKLFFSKFHYAGFGFQTSLKDGRFQLRGKYHSRGVQYIMYAHWYQFPRVEIVNSQPKLDYDWEAIFENLRDVYRSSPAEPGNGANP